MTINNCINTWCKYHSGFYCQENCGLYIPSGTVLENINKSKLKVNDYALFRNHALVARGTFDNIIKGYETDIVKSVNYDCNTFCISI